MAQTLKFGKGTWATKTGSSMAYNDQNGNYKPLPFNVERDSIATRVNKEGLIEVVGKDKLRIDYTDSAKGVALLEPQRTNLNTFSDPTDAQKGSTSYASVTFQDNFNWGLGSVLENAIVFVDNSTTRYAYYNSTVSSGTEYTLSAFIKMDDNSVPIPATDFLMVLAGISFASGYNVESYGNNIYRVSVSGTASASNTANGILKVASHSAKTFNVTGFQVEQGSYATSYIPTQGSAVTRLADECEQTPPDGVIGQTEGTLFAEFEYFGNTSGALEISPIYIGTGTYATAIYADIYQGELYAVCFNSGVSQASINCGALSVGTHKVAIGYSNNDIVIYLDGLLAGSDTSATIPECNKLYLGTVGTSTSVQKYTQSQAKLYNTRLSNSELAALTQV